MRFIEDMREGEKICDIYFVKKKDSLKSKSDKTYYSLKLQDKTGIIDAKVWELNNKIHTFEEGNYIKIVGETLSYQNNIQLKIYEIKVAQEGEYNPVEYMPSTDRNIDEMLSKFNSIMSSIEDENMKKLVQNVYQRDDIKNKVTLHAAGKSMHHAYIGGYLEHVLGVVEVCDSLAKLYPDVNRDLLITSAFLHDIGKIYELSSFPENDYTDAGQLLGHLVIGVEVVTLETNKMDSFPAETKNLIKHCILASHGEYEYGSPKLPSILEAFILNMADNIDAKVNMFNEATKSEKGNVKWLGYNRMLGRNIRKTNI